MKEEEKDAIEEFEKNLRLAINVDVITTTIRNDDAQTILNLIEKLQKENEELLELKVSASAHNRILELEKENEELKRLHIQDNKHLDFIMEHSILVQKVRDKIEELKQYKISLLKEDYAKKQKNFTSQNVLVCSAIRDISASGKIEILQELIEGRK